MKTTAIILAAGNGTRMNNGIKKQYREINGNPVLSYSLMAFEKSKVDNIVIVCAEADKAYCQESLVDKYGIKKVTDIVVGGKERYDSVYEGLKAVKVADYVLIHDGARPLIEVEDIDRSIEFVTERKACVIGVPAKDTIQIVDMDGVIIRTTDRKITWIAQTPQSFEYKLIYESYKRAIEAGDTSLTDDASIAIKYGMAKVYMLNGKYSNIKITTEDDIHVVEDLMRKQQNDQKL